jgi:formylglycine-generating enzyme required for sulfatase activity
VVRQWKEAARRQDETAKTIGIGKELVLNLGNKTTMKLVLIPAGKFMMGSPGAEKGHRPDESPQHQVEISKPFYLGIHVVTQEQYQRVMGTNPSYGKGKQNPVETVFWGDAVEFCKTLSKMTGQTVQLPTEAQWEYACRAGTTTRFYYGEDDGETQLGEYGWYWENCTIMQPIGLKKPNAWGLYDMHGNAFQMCSDWYDGGYYTNSPKKDPQGPKEGKFHVTRGGCWITFADGCRTSQRYGCESNTRRGDMSFRVVVLPGNR